MLDCVRWNFSTNKCSRPALRCSATSRDMRKKLMSGMMFGTPCSVDHAAQASVGIYLVYGSASQRPGRTDQSEKAAPERLQSVGPLCIHPCAHTSTCSSRISVKAIPSRPPAQDPAISACCCAKSASSESVGTYGGLNSKISTECRRRWRNGLASEPCNDSMGTY